MQIISISMLAMLNLISTATAAKLVDANTLAGTNDQNADYKVIFTENFLAELGESLGKILDNFSGMANKPPKEIAEFFYTLDFLGFAAIENKAVDAGQTQGLFGFFNNNWNYVKNNIPTIFTPDRNPDLVIAIGNWCLQGTNDSQQLKEIKKYSLKKILQKIKSENSSGSLKTERTNYNADDFPKYSEFLKRAKKHLESKQQSAYYKEDFKNACASLMDRAIVLAIPIDDNVSATAKKEQKINNFKKMLKYLEEVAALGGNHELLTTKMEELQKKFLEEFLKKDSILRVDEGLEAHPYKEFLAEAKKFDESKPKTVKKTKEVLEKLTTTFKKDFDSVFKSFNEKTVSDFLTQITEILTPKLSMNPGNFTRISSKNNDPYYNFNAWANKKNGRTTELAIFEINLATKLKSPSDAEEAIDGRKRKSDDDIDLHKQGAIFDDSKKGSNKVQSFLATNWKKSLIATITALGLSIGSFFYLTNRNKKVDRVRKRKPEIIVSPKKVPTKKIPKQTNQKANKDIINTAK